MVRKRANRYEYEPDGDPHMYEADMILDGRAYVDEKGMWQRSGPYRYVGFAIVAAVVAASGGVFIL